MESTSRSTNRLFRRLNSKQARSMRRSAVLVRRPSAIAIHTSMQLKGIRQRLCSASTARFLTSQSLLYMQGLLSCRVTWRLYQRSRYARKNPIVSQDIKALPSRFNVTLAQSCSRKVTYSNVSNAKVSTYATSVSHNKSSAYQRIKRKTIPLSLTGNGSTHSW